MKVLGRVCREAVAFVSGMVFTWTVVISYMYYDELIKPKKKEVRENVEKGVEV